MSVSALPSDFLMMQGLLEQMTEIPILSWEPNFFPTVFEGPHIGSHLMPFEFKLKLYTLFDILLTLSDPTSNLIRQYDFPVLL
jgi:hypothetical protein